MRTWFRFHFWECQCAPVLSAGFGDSPRLFTMPNTTFYFITYPCPAVLPTSDTSISWLRHGDRGSDSQLSSSEKSPQSLSALHTSRRFIHRPSRRMKHGMNAFFPGWTLNDILSYSLLRSSSVYFFYSHKELQSNTLPPSNENKNLCYYIYLWVY